MELAGTFALGPCQANPGWASVFACRAKRRSLVDHTSELCGRLPSELESGLKPKPGRRLMTAVRTALRRLVCPVAWLVPHDQRLGSPMPRLRRDRSRGGTSRIRVPELRYERNRRHLDLRAARSCPAGVGVRRQHTVTGTLDPATPPHCNHLPGNTLRPYALRRPVLRKQK